MVKDLVGQRFGRLVVVARSHDKQSHNARWLCRCDCGKETVVPSNRLPNGKTKSCGCLSAELSAKRKTTHGMSGTPEHSIWKGMMRRSDPNHSWFPSYTAKGVRVCDRWKQFENFYADMGKRPSKKHSLDRIDNNGDYEPGNVRWATPKQQANNKSNVRKLSFNGEEHTISEWSDRIGIQRHTLYMRIHRCGWTVKDALTTPVGERKHGPANHKV